MIDELSGIQWPFPDSGHPPGRDSLRRAKPRHAESAGHLERQRRLFEDGLFFHADGRARFLFESPRKMPEPPNSRYPYLLLTGRGTAAQWHTQTRTAKSGVLRQLGPQQIYVEVSPTDARREGIRSSQEVIVESQRGRLRAKAFVTPTVQPGQVFIPMHYDATNQLTHAHFDPYSKQPSYKDCAVRVRRAESWDDV
jgi:assimilatory nitrate reductase catalytic subunit